MIASFAVARSSTRGLKIIVEKVNFAITPYAPSPSPLVPNALLRLHLHDIHRRLLERLIKRSVLDRQSLFRLPSLDPYWHHDFIVILCDLPLQFRHPLQRGRNVLEDERMPNQKALICSGLGC